MGGRGGVKEKTIMWRVGFAFSMAVCPVFFLANSSTAHVREETTSQGRQKLQKRLEQVTASFNRFGVLSGGVVNPRRRSNSHSEASRLDSRLMSKQREWEESTKRLLLETCSLSTLRDRSEPGWAVAVWMLRGFRTRVEALLGVKLIALQDIVGSELHEGGRETVSKRLIGFRCPLEALSAALKWIPSAPISILKGSRGSRGISRGL